MIAAAFGPALLDKAFSPIWQQRVEALELMQQRLARAHASEPDGDEPSRSAAASKLFDATVAILLPALADKLVPVCLAALAGVRQAFVETPAAVPDATLRAGLAALLPRLVQRAASQSSGVVKSQATLLLTALAHAPHLGAAAVLPGALAPIGAKAERTVGGRLELLATLVGEFGLGAHSGLFLTDTFEFAARYADTQRSELIAKGGRSTRGLALALLSALQEHDSKATLALVRARRPELERALAREGDDVLREAALLTGSVGSRLAEGRVLPPRAARVQKSAFPEFELVVSKRPPPLSPIAWPTSFATHGLGGDSRRLSASDTPLQSSPVGLAAPGTKAAAAGTRYLAPAAPTRTPLATHVATQRGPDDDGEL
jgi:hypothetical protein